MPKWTVDNGDIAVGRFRITSGSPREMVGWHNADIDALTAERDKWQEIAQGEVEINVELRGKLAELQRRLDAVVASVPDEPLDRPSNPNVTDLAIWRERNGIRRSIKAIAEGREG